MLPLSPTSKSLIDELQSLGGGAHTRFERVTTICKIKPQAVIDSCLAASKQDCDLNDTPDSQNSKLLLSTDRQGTYVELSSKEMSVTVEEKFRDGSDFKKKSFSVDKVIDPIRGNKENLEYLLLKQGSELSLIDQLWRGFNVSFISFGDSGSGKSHSIFGQENQSASFFSTFISKLFDKIQRESSAIPKDAECDCAKFLVGFTMFELQYKSTPGVKKVEYVVDLLNSSIDNTDGDLLNVIVQSKEQIDTLITSGKKRSKNFDKQGKRIIRNAAHLFIRVMVYDTEQHQISTFHLVDMIGNKSSFKLTDDPMEMGVSSGLAAFKQMVSEMARQCKKNERFPKLKASRHSKLTQLVSPLLCGNSKAVVLGCIDSEHKYENICGTLDLLEKASQISVQLKRNDSVKRKDLSFIYFASYASRHLSARETRKSTTPVKKKNQLGETQETVTVADLNEESQRRVQETFKWINEFQEKKEQRLKSAVEDARRANQEIQKLRKRSVSSERGVVSDQLSSNKFQSGLLGKLGSGNASLGSTVRMLRIKEEIASLMNKLDDAGKSGGGTLNKESKQYSLLSPPQPKTGPMLVNQTVNPLVLTTEMTHQFGQNTQQQHTFQGCSPIRGTLGHTEFTLSSNGTSPRVASPMNFRKENIPINPPETSSSYKRAGRQMTESKKSIENLPGFSSVASIHKLSQDSQAKIIRGEYYLLKQNYQSLQNELKTIEISRISQDERIKELENQLQEEKMKQQIEIDDLKLKNINLYSKVRAMQENSPMQEVFKLYNDDIEKLQMQLKTSQQTVLKLTKANQSDKDAELKKVIRGLQKDILRLTKQNSELSGKSRHFAVQSKIIEESTRKANYFKNSAKSARATAEEKTLESLKSQADYEKLKEEVLFLRNQNEELLKDNGILAEEIALLRDFAYNTDNDALRKHYHNFVKTARTGSGGAAATQPQVQILSMIRRIERRILPQIKQSHEQNELQKILENLKNEAQNLGTAFSTVVENQEHLIDLLSTVQDKIEVGIYKTGEIWVRRS